MEPRPQTRDTEIKAPYHPPGTVEIQLYIVHPHDGESAVKALERCGLRLAVAHQMRAGLLTDGTRRTGSGVGESGVNVGVQTGGVGEPGGKKGVRFGDGERVV